jgi:predicted TIM-barrel fold metal-dependent hydrolase
MTTMLYLLTAQLLPTCLVALFTLAGVKALSIPRPQMQKRIKSDTHTASSPDQRMPAGSWDSHLHVLNPVNYPLDPDATYRPGVYTVWDTALFEHSLGVDRIVLVQPSIYGTDNSLLLNTLRAVGPDRARGVVVFEPLEVDQDELREWHSLGVRGVRVNLISNSDDSSVEEISALLRSYAEIIRPFDWVLQLYVEMSFIPKIEHLVSHMGVGVVFDHLGVPALPKCHKYGPKNLDPYSIAGFSSLARLVSGGNAWVKISGAYRETNLVNSTTWNDLDPVILELMRVSPERVVYASDWPHTRYEGLDIRPWTSHLLDLTEGDEQLRQKLFRDNASQLWNRTGQL